MAIDYDQFWMPGVVRIRASKPDPYAGLHGHDYIKARGLGIGHVKRLDAFDKDATVKRVDTEQRAVNIQEAGTNMGVITPAKPRHLFMIPSMKRSAR